LASSQILNSTTFEVHFVSFEAALAIMKAAEEHSTRSTSRHRYAIFNGDVGSVIACLGALFMQLGSGSF
jgi:hypothetical protein